MKKLIALATLFVSCESTPPAQPPIDTVNWKTYTNYELGYSLQHPSVYSVHEDEQGVFFRLKGYPVLVVRYLKSIEDQQSIDRLQIYDDENLNTERRTWTRYTFDHYDAVFYSSNVAFIKPFNKQFITIQFRVDKELDPVHRQILKSFKSK